MTINRYENGFFPTLARFTAFFTNGLKFRGLVRAKKTGRREGRWGRFPAGEGEENRLFEFSLLVVFYSLYNNYFT
jgi:hypothetical protein